MKHESNFFSRTPEEHEELMRGYYDIAIRELIRCGIDPAEMSLADKKELMDLVRKAFTPEFAPKNPGEKMYSPGVEAAFWWLRDLGVPEELYNAYSGGNKPWSSTKILVAYDKNGKVINKEMFHENSWNMREVGSREREAENRLKAQGIQYEWFNETLANTVHKLFDMWHRLERKRRAE